MKKEKILIVVDMQNDFLTGALRNEEGISVIGYIRDKVEKADDETKIIFTKDTHQKNYMETEEGANLPVSHCIEGSEGWEITKELLPYSEKNKVFCKDTFGSRDLAKFLEEEKNNAEIEEVELVGVCTDICVISNAIVAKTALPDVKVYVDAAGCAGVTPESHDTAIKAMKACHVHIRNEGKEGWR